MNQHPPEWLREQAHLVREHTLARIRSSWWMPVCYASCAAMNLWVALLPWGGALPWLHWSVVALNLFSCAGCLRVTYLELSMWFVGLGVARRVEAHLHRIEREQHHK